MKKKLMILFTMLPFVLLINGCILSSSSFEIVSALDTVEIYSEYIDHGAIYTNVGLKETVYSQDVVDTSVLGLYEMNYEYIFEEETFSTIRYVIVVDQNAPNIELNLGLDTITVGNTWIDQGVAVVDNSLEEIIAVVSGSVNTQIVGTYEIEYTATDSSGNVSTISRFVTVVTDS